MASVIYPERGVIVFLTDEHDDKGIKVKEKDLGSKEAYMNTVGSDKLIRPVINIAFHYEGSPDKYIKSLVPPVKILVAYKKKDKDKADEKKTTLKLMWLKEGTWHEFTDADKFDYEDHDSILWDGWGTAEISDWGDPPIAWGT